jgi:hypothetical protein
VNGDPNNLIHPEPVLSPGCDVRRRNIVHHAWLIGRKQKGRDLMKGLKFAAAAALIASTMAGPAMARDYCATHRCYHRGPVGAAADATGAAVGTAAGIAGAAIGTAGAIATAPFRNSYAYDPYADPNNGFVCRPGTWFRGADGRRHPCQ